MIRIVAMMLLAANLLYFGWSQWVGRDNAQLTAVATTPRKPRPELPPPAPPPPPPCATIGPFNNELVAVQAQQKLEAGGWGVMRRDGNESIHEGWWVHIANADTDEQARTLNALRRGGIRDAFALPEDPQFSVSVGIFADENRAEDRAMQVQKLKLDAVVTERMRDRAAIWLDVPGVARETLADGRLAGTGIALERIRIEVCPEKPAASALAAEGSGAEGPAPVDAATGTPAQTATGP
jgi:hypothetical protein